MRFRENCWGRHLLFSPSTNQHNFCYDTFRIFENCTFKPMLKLTNMYLSWKGCVWEIIYGEEIYYVRLAQFGTTFIFSKEQNGGACKQFFFSKLWSQFSIFFSKSFAAQSSTILAQLSTTFVFSKKQNGGAGKKIVFSKF